MTRYPLYNLTDTGVDLVYKEKVKVERKDNKLKKRLSTFITNNEGCTSKEISRGTKQSLKNVINSLRELSRMKVVYMEKEEKIIRWYIK